MKNRLAFSTVKRRVQRALGRFLETDRALLENDVAELTITNRVAAALASEFPGRHIDTNYNRHGRYVKQLQLPPPCRNWQNPKRRVSPDIVVHRRGTDVANVLVVEIKKSTNNEDRACDMAKLRAFRGQLCYQYGLFFDFETGTPEPGPPQIVWEVSPIAQTDGR